LIFGFGFGDPPRRNHPTTMPPKYTPNAPTAAGRYWQGKAPKEEDQSSSDEEEDEEEEQEREDDARQAPNRPPSPSFAMKLRE
jgi:hypothetical protein